MSNHSVIEYFGSNQPLPNLTVTQISGPMDDMSTQCISNGNCVSLENCQSLAFACLNDYQCTSDKFGNTITCTKNNSKIVYKVSKQ